MEMSNISFAGLIVCSLAACSEPGRGARFEKAKAEAEQVVFAIEGYKERDGFYPESLDALAPKDLSSAFLSQHHPGSEVGMFYGRTSPDSYEFWFKYTDAGMNRCAWRGTLKEPRWECTGYW
jgi:hypothetical protein